MRPVKLTMKAFGSYAQKTVVDFEELKGGLYLIVGKTGAGKTTIFDAISFALFGKPSGSEREARMLHSDFAPMNEDTVVTLAFIHQERKYEVTRTIHFRKKRETNEYSDPEIQAVLTGEEMQPLEKSSKVTARCEELLGMKAEQFRRIVMLAQGEFREFMKANSEKKNEILGRLFDSAEYVRYQNLLKAVRKEMEDTYRKQQDLIDNTMQTIFVCPEDEAHPEAYLPGNPHLLTNLQALIDRETARWTELQAVGQQQRMVIEALNKRKGAAESIHVLFAELTKKRNHQDELARQEPQIMAEKAVYLAAETALHRVKPLDEAAAKAYDDLVGTQKKYEEQKTLLAQHQTDMLAAERQLEADKALEPKIDECKAAASAIAKTLPTYQELSKAQGQLIGITQGYTAVKARLAEMETQKASYATRLAELREVLQSLEGCEAEAAHLENAGKELRRRSEAIQKISEEIDSICRDEKTLDSMKKKLLSLSEDASMAEKAYHELYQRFISGQAGLLAQGMERALSETGEAVCPVCKTHFRRDSVHHFQALSENVPSQAAVDQAETRRKETEEMRSRQDVALREQIAALEQRRAAAIEKIRGEGYDCSDWAALTAPDFIRGIQNQLANDLTAKRAEYKEIQKKNKQKEAARKDEEIIRLAQEAWEKEYSETDRKRQQYEQQIVGLQNTIVQMKKQLPYESEANARKELQNLQQRIAGWQSLLQEHQDAYQKASEMVSAASGGIGQLEASLPAKETAVQNAKDALICALRESGFSTYEVYRAALMPIDSDNAEKWLMTRRERLESYENDRKNTAQRIEELEKMTEGKTEEDLEKLQKDLEAATEAQRRWDEKITVHHSVMTRHQSVLQKVAEAKKALDGLDNAYRRSRNLADMAVGTSGEGGRLSFDRYVMGAIFRDVLDMANRRLNIMTGGRFELIHKIEADRKTAAAGLEMEVLDNTTGKQRPSASISGGEGFMVSLALALGLSDVVQNHAGGQKLDTLFIDEGFGTLDDGMLDNVISVLQQLTQGNRLVGIISHVDKLEESIPQKLRISGGEHGSTLRLELS